MNENLETAPLDCFADVVMGQSPDSTLVNSGEVGLPFLQGCAEFGRQSPQANLYCSPPLRVAPAQSVLVSVRAPVGKSNWADQSYCIGRGLGAFKAKPGQADTHFLHYALEQNVAHLHRRSQGSTFSAIGGEDLKKFPVPAFDFPIQTKIANVLQTVEEAIEQTEALIEKYSLMKAGMMHDLFTRGLTPDGKLRPLREEAPDLYKETAIGWLPKDWDSPSLGDVTPEGASICYGLVQPGAHDWNGVPIVAIHNLNRSFTDVHRSSSEVEAKYARSRIKEGDVLLSIKGTIGRVDTVPSGFVGNVSRDVARIRPLESVDSKFLRQYFQTAQAQRQFMKIVVGSTRMELSINRLKKIPIILPPKGEQMQISSQISALETLLTSELANLAKSELQKSGLTHDLFTGTVAVTVNEPEAEAAHD